MIGWSVGAHLFLVGMAVVSPRPSGRIDPSQVVSVDLVAIPAPASRAAAPPPKAAPPEPTPPPEVKPPPPEPPKPKEIVLPKNPERDPSKPKPKPKPVVKQPEPEPDKNLE